MPPRPEGTDGSDHNYRMVIIDRYKRMAEFRHTIVRLLYTHAAFVVLKSCWHLLGMLEDLPFPTYLTAMLVGEAIVISIYFRAKPGHAKESLNLLKTFNVLQAVLTAMHVLSTWQYHNNMMDPGVLIPDLLGRYVVRQGLQLPVSTGTALSVAKSLELFLDLTLGAFMLMCVFVSHRMIMEKMEAKRAGSAATVAAVDAAAAAKKDDGDAPGAGGGSQDAADDAPRVVAAASDRTRARRRLA